MDMGEEAALLGVHLQPAVDAATQELVIRLEIVGGHASPILGAFVPRRVPVGELVRLPLSKVRAVLKGAAPPAVETPVRAGQEADSPPAEAPAGGPSLLVVP